MAGQPRAQGIIVSGAAEGERVVSVDRIREAEKEAQEVG